jgi:hypothetical protein
MTLSIMVFSITTLSITALSIMKLLSNIKKHDTRHKMTLSLMLLAIYNTECRYAGCRVSYCYAECRGGLKGEQKSVKSKNIE